MARGTILEEVGGAMPFHESLHLIVMQLAIPLPFHEFSRVQEHPLQLKQPHTMTLGVWLTVFLEISGAHWSDSLG